MASGDSLFEFRAPIGSSPGSSYAQSDVKLGASSPAENLRVYAFDAAVDEYIDFYGTIPEHYEDGGLALELEVSAASATTSNFRLAAAFRLRATTDDWDNAHTYDFNEVSVTVPGTLGNSVIGTITFTDGADMDSVAAGDPFVLRIWRNKDHADDAASGDMHLERAYGKES